MSDISINQIICQVVDPILVAVVKGTPFRIRQTAKRIVVEFQKESAFEDYEVYQSEGWHANLQAAYPAKPIIIRGISETLLPISHPVDIDAYWAAEKKFKIFVNVALSNSGEPLEQKTRCDAHFFSDQLQRYGRGDELSVSLAADLRQCFTLDINLFRALEVLAEASPWIAAGLERIFTLTPANPQAVLAAGRTLMLKTTSQKRRAQARTQIGMAWEQDDYLVDTLFEYVAEHPDWERTLVYVLEEIELYRTVLREANDASYYFQPSKEKYLIGEAACCIGFYGAERRIKELPDVPTLRDIAEQVRCMIFKPEIFNRHLDTHFSRYMMKWYHVGIFDQIRNIAWTKCVGGALDQKYFLLLQDVYSAMQVIGGRKELVAKTQQLLAIHTELNDERLLNQVFGEDQDLAQSFRQYHLDKLTSLQEQLMAAPTLEESKEIVGKYLHDGGFFIVQAEKMLGYSA